MRVVQEQKLFGDVLGFFDTDFTGEFGEHPDSFAFAQSSGCMVAEVSVGNYRVQETKTLVVLDGLVAVADHPQDIVSVGADDRFALGDFDPLLLSL